VQSDVDGLKSALAGDDDDAVKTAFDKLNASQQKLGEAIYASAQADAGSAAGGPSTGSGTDSPDGESSESDEDVVDAEVVDDEESPSTGSGTGK
jgi:molecular chaperone DnaK